jgi:hypothetical protein
MDSDIEGLLEPEPEVVPVVEEETPLPWYSVVGRIKQSLNSIKGYINRINRILGWRFLLYLGCSQLLCKGALRQIVNSLMLPLFRESVDAAQLQIYVLIVMIPWTCKPILGILSDSILIGGYKKRGWVIVGILLAIACCVGLFFTLHLPLVLVFMFMGVQLMIALIDLLSEAKYAEIRQENSELGSDASTLAQGMQSVGVILVMTFVGFIGDAKLFYLAFSIILVLTISPLLPTLWGWLPEVRQLEGAFVQLVDRDKLYRDRWAILVIAFCSVSSVSAALVATFVSPMAGLIVAGILLVACLAGCWMVFPSGITQVALYQVISTLSQPAMGSALDFYYTADSQCLPDGPHFSYAYYLSYTGFVGNVLGLFGVVFYQRYLSQLRFRPVLIITTILTSLAGVSDLVIIYRLNIMVGIPDYVAYMFGEAILESFIMMINWIAISALIAISVEPGMEASTFAYLAGISNFARGVSELAGVVIYTAAGINTTTGTCDFTTIGPLVMLNHIALPIMIGVPAVFLVNNIYQTDKLNEA